MGNIYILYILIIIIYKIINFLIQYNFIFYLIIKKYFQTIFLQNYNLNIIII